MQVYAKYIFQYSSDSFDSRRASSIVFTDDHTVKPYNSSLDNTDDKTNTDSTDDHTVIPYNSDSPSFALVKQPIILNNSVQ